ncbi:MAG TPA: branched-chain amino acid ABC transporter permease [Thermoanaerobaculia bacterium]|nr:branched-chain amino acid ABC transporter permease [Thermoanaerobaculia bacterium]
MLGQVIVNGLAFGSIYALIALAMAIVYKSSSVPNFAQGEMAMITTFIAWLIASAHGAPFGMALAAALLSAAAIGFFLEFAFIRRAKQPTVLNLIIITLGFQMVLYGLAGWRFGPEQRRLSLPVSEREVVRMGEVVVSHLTLLTFATAAILMLAVWLFFGFTRWGAALRATQQNRLAARIHGVPVDRLLGLSFAISAVVGAIAGMLIAPMTTLDPTMMWDPLLKGFAAAVLGGLTSLPGVVVGGLLLGVIENLFGAYVSLEFKSIVAFLVIVLVLCFRPSGLFGRHYVRKV